MALTLSMPTLPKRSDGGVPRSQAERLWLIGGALVAVVLALIGYFLAISPQRSKTSDVNSQVAAARAQNATLEAHIAALNAQNKNLAKYQAQLKAAELALPSGADVSNFLRSLQSLGNATQTNVANMTVGAATAVAPAATATSSAAPAAASATPASTGLLNYPISIQVTGLPASLNKFLEQLQDVQPRAVLITQLTESSGTTTPGAPAHPGGTTLQLSMQAFATSAPTAPH